MKWETAFVSTKKSGALLHSPVITHTHGDAQRRRPARRSVRCPPPSHPAPAAPPSASHKLRHSLRHACLWRHKQGHSTSCPPSAHPCTWRTPLPPAMPHTPAAPPSFSAGPALMTYSTAHAVLCGTWTHTWYTHAQPQSHASACAAPLLHKSPPVFACTTGCAHTHALLARAVDPPPMPCVLIKWPALPLVAGLHACVSNHSSLPPFPVAGGDR